MSQTAIFSGLYEEVREYAELLDKVLVEMKGERSLPLDEKRKRLGQFLAELGASQTRHLLARMISILLRREGRVSPQELARIGDRLNSPDEIKPDRVMINQLEQLAQSLEREQAVAMARMRGKDL